MNAEWNKEWLDEANISGKSDAEVLEVISRYPNSARTFAAVLTLFTRSQNGEDCCLDDWECNLGDVIVDEISSKQ